MKKGQIPSVLSIVTVILFIVWVLPANASDSSTEVKKLRDSVDTLQKRIDDLEKGQQAPAQKQDNQAKEEKKKGILPIKPYYNDGFFLETADEQFRLNITGVLQADARFYDGAAKKPNSWDTYSANSFDIRRARIDLRGWAYKNNVFRLQLEMADSPYLRNAYWLFKKWPEVQLQLGQFKIPVGGADWLTEEAQINFIEYSADTPISPFFDRGLMIWGLPFDGIVQYCLGVFNGVGADFDVPQGDLDKSKDFASRVMLVPFKKTEIELLKGLHIAGGYQYGMESIKTSRGETNNRTENYESQWFKWNPTNANLDHRDRWGAECHYILGPFTASYEYNRLEWHNITAFTSDGSAVDFSRPDTYFVDVHQVWFSFFLTGEQKELQDVFFSWRQPKPKKNFSLKEGTWGAWELLVRAAFRDGSRALFDKVNGKGPILAGAREGHSITGGINWTANPKVRVMFDVNYLKNDDGKYNGIISTRSIAGGAKTDTHYLDHEIGFIMRCVLTI